LTSLAGVRADFVAVNVADFTAADFTVRELSF
jgi:hypothetical protein